MTNATNTVSSDGKNDGKSKEDKVVVKPPKKELFERYFTVEARRQKAEAEVSATLKIIKDNYGKGPYHVPGGIDKTIVERSVKNEEGEVIGKLYFFRSVGGEIQDIE